MEMGSLHTGGSWKQHQAAAPGSSELVEAGSSGRNRVTVASRADEKAVGATA